MVEKSQFYVPKEFIPEIKLEKDYGSYPNLDFEDKFSLLFPKLSNFIHEKSIFLRKANIKITKLKLKITSHRIFFEIQNARFVYLINLDTIREIKAHVFSSKIYLKHCIFNLENWSVFKSSFDNRINSNKFK